MKTFEETINYIKENYTDFCGVKDVIGNDRIKVIKLTIDRNKMFAFEVVYKYEIEQAVRPYSLSYAYDGS